MAKPFTDKELVGYFEIHSKTERALFHWKHIRDLYRIAGLSIPKGLEKREFWAVSWEDCKPHVTAARKRLKEDAA